MSEVKCDKCKKISDTNDWESGTSYEGNDRHHNPPEEIYRFLKLKWVGEMFNLCRKCHTDLHKEITLMLKKYSNAPRYNSDYWLMKNSTIGKIIEAKDKIYLFTKKWVGKNDTKTTTN